ncbi:MAG: glycosyltransferase family 9 protein, partial [Candidatus Marinimicrobia bacterium]|nr:glycosyltransferase family 9 protein [Candidatus Neomarinimicrobiota bacterium]
MLVNKDCRYFRGDIPCIFNKREGIHCDNCKYYSKTKEKILIIKLGAIGDVIRTTPLLVKLKNEYPESMIYWFTLTPEILPNSIDKKLDFELKNILFVENTTFDILINLDKDLEACALAKEINAKKKFGFTLANGVPIPINDFAKHKYFTGLFDDISQINKKSYVEEIFEICGYKFSGEKYLINRDNLNYHWDL